MSNTEQRLERSGWYSLITLSGASGTIAAPRRNDVVIINGARYRVSHCEWSFNPHSGDVVVDVFGMRESI